MPAPRLPQPAGHCATASITPPNLQQARQQPTSQPASQPAGRLASPSVPAPRPCVFLQIEEQISAMDATTGDFTVSLASRQHALRQSMR